MAGIKIEITLKSDMKKINDFSFFFKGLLILKIIEINEVTFDKKTISLILNKEKDFNKLISEIKDYNFLMENIESIEHV